MAKRRSRPQPPPPKTDPSVATTIPRKASYWSPELTCLGWDDPVPHEERKLIHLWYLLDTIAYYRERCGRLAHVMTIDGMPVDDDGRVFHYSEEYHAWKPTINRLRRAMSSVGILTAQTELTSSLIRGELLNWFGVVHSLSDTDALNLSVRQVIKLLSPHVGGWSEPLTPSEVAKKYRVCAKTVTRWCRDQSGPVELRRVARGRYQYRARSE